MHTATIGRCQNFDFISTKLKHLVEKKSCRNAACIFSLLEKPEIYTYRVSGAAALWYFFIMFSSFINSVALETLTIL